MSKARVIIIGAGISGLTLARCLEHRGLSATINERDTAQRFASRHGYGITLWTYKSLAEVLGYVNSNDFRTKIAVDAETGGTGHIGGISKGVSHSPFRVNRQKFEHLLADGLDIRWGHKLQGIETSAANGDGKTIQLHFENDHRVEADVVVGADGVHSQVRKDISPSAGFNILPYAVYNGKRKVSRATFAERYAPSLGVSTTTEQDIGGVHLAMSVDNYKGEQVYISYTYLRPAKDNDALFRPDRPMSGAGEVPSELFDEITSLHGLNKPFDAVFNPDDLKNDRLLHWLMRSVSTDEADLDRAAGQGVVLLADAVHGGPILGGDGANVAIEDSLELAKHLSWSQPVDWRDFYRSRSERWISYVKESEDRLAKMHGQPVAHL